LIPFLTAGVGGVTVDPRTSSRVPFPAAFCPEDAATCEYEPADVILDQRQHTQIAAVGSVGADWFVDPNLALRIQLKNYWTDRSPYRRASDETFHRGGNNVVLTGGLAFFFGGTPV